LIVKDEAKALGASFKIEKHVKQNISEEIQALAKLAKRKFRIKLRWVRDDSLVQAGVTAGTGHIETEWQIRLKSSGTFAYLPSLRFIGAFMRLQRIPRFLLGAFWMSRCYGH
jgi:hypothetical protein